MVTKECKMKDFSKLDAIPAAMLVQLASRFESSIYVDQGARRTNAKSIMGVMILNFTTGTDAIITVNGADEEVALEEVYKFLSV